MITIMKASAGSGKTYTLAKKYMDMLLESSDPHEYRHILAVTFTNKATDEMKERIVTMLAESDHPRAAGILNDILHDYTSFAVSTIDKFFQQTLRAFARELGQFGRYQVELDKNALVDEAVDSILDELNADDKEDAKMIDFIVENVEDSISEGGRLDVESDLKSMARELKSEKFCRKCEELGLQRESAYSQQALSGLKKTCRGIISDYEKLVRDRAAAVRDAMQKAGFCAADFLRSWPNAIIKYTEWKHGEMELEISQATGRKIFEPAASDWFKKADQAKFPEAYGAMGDALNAFASALKGEEFRCYNTALELLKQVYGLGIAGRLFRSFDRLAKEKNVVCLDESNSLLRQIIDGSDAPFVYEKTGVRFKTFLLDEFQDTSVTQWDNFLPLLIQSQSEKPHQTDDHTFDNLIVGDVKQSIYRWREGDWGLLDHQVEAAFPGQIHMDPLDRNFRSLEKVVEFNNALYPFLAAKLDEMVPAPQGMPGISKIYEGCGQTLGKPEKQKGGCIEVGFCQDAQAQVAAIIECIADLRDNHNAKLSDIAVLVRTRQNGTLVAQSLIDAGIDVVTDASLRVKNSVSVRRLVSMMSYVDNPDNKVASYIAGEYGMDALPSSYHSLPDLAETLYGILCSDPSHHEDCCKEVMYLASFMDFVMDYSATNGNNLHEFLAFWEEKDPEVNASGAADAVRITTIHKSKGLAFRYVILPFVDKINLYESRKTKIWAAPRSEGTALQPFSDRLYHVSLNEKSLDTQYSEEYLLERYNQAIDALNMMYVATTRAKIGMKILCGCKGGMSELMAAFCMAEKGTAEGCAWGELPVDFASVADDGGEGMENVELKFPYHPIGSRLGIRPYAADFFTREDNALENLSYRERGIVLHDILSRIFRAEDMEPAVDKAIADGALAASSRAKVVSFLSRRIASHPELFPERDVKVLTEETYFDTDGSEHRPDRVMLHRDGSVCIVDFKFGTPKEEYREQIESYKRIFEKMGYGSVKAWLWFVYQDFVTE